MYNHHNRILEIKFWIVRMIDIYGPNKEVYISFNHKNQIITYSIEDNLEIYLDKLKTKSKRTILKYFYQYVLQIEHKEVDEFIIFLIAHKETMNLSYDELSSIMEIDSSKLRRIMNGTIMVNDEDKKSYCEKIGLNYYDIIKNFDIYFVD